MTNVILRPPIVAVFGSKENLEIAEALGEAVARSGATLLTGGNTPNGDYVKNKAIAGAESVHGRWIGVHRHDCLRAPSYQEAKASLILEPGLGHRRNFLEACLCDVAIALEGGKGTISEVSACNFLRKPVVLIDWNSEINVNLKWLYDDKCKPNIEALDQTIKEWISTPFSGEGIIHIGAHTPANEIVGEALNCIGSARVGRFPAFLGERYLGMSNAFETFIRQRN
jgi:predicted Rossmann-fold nucleotide-binding protein